MVSNALNKIKDIRVLLLSSDNKKNDHSAKKEWPFTHTISSPMSIYPEYHDSRQSWGMSDMLDRVVVEIEDKKGNIGVGIGSGGIATAFIINKHLKRFLINQFPSYYEKIWDQMWRSSLHYGRKGLAVMAISAADLAVWDLLGKQRQEPVYEMIGGQLKSEIPLYATTINYKYARKTGFWGAKLPLSFGPCDGHHGLMENIRKIEEARNVVGEDFNLMYDCWMSLDVPYTIELAKLLEPLRIKWLEEFLQPDDYDGLVQVKNSVTSCLLATGEHEYTRYGFLEILKRRCIDIIQPDLTWCGGLTETLNIVKLAKAYNVMVIPHASSVYSYHLVISQSNSPLSEYPILGPKGDNLIPTFGNLFLDEPLPKKGKIKLSDKPGFGVTLNKRNLKFKKLVF